MRTATNNKTLRQQQFFHTQQALFNLEGEMNQMRAENAMLQGQLAGKDSEATAKEDEVKLLRKNLSTIIDAWKLIDYNSQQAVLKARTYAYNDSRYLNDSSMKLNQHIVQLPRGDKNRKEFEKARDVQISVVRGYIATLDNCLEHLSTYSSRLL